MTESQPSFSGQNTFIGTIEQLLVNSGFAIVFSALCSSDLNVRNHVVRGKTAKHNYVLLHHNYKLMLETSNNNYGKHACGFSQKVLCCSSSSQVVAEIRSSCWGACKAPLGFRLLGAFGKLELLASSVECELDEIETFNQS